MELTWYSVLGLTVGVVGALMPTVFYRVRDAFRALPLPAYLKPALGGFFLGIIALYLPEILGGGYGWIQLALDGKLPILLLATLVVGKIVAMALTVGSGGSGEIFAPTLFVGAMLGGALGSLIGEIGFFAPNHAGFVVIGTAALFGCASRAPVVSLIMITEMTGGYGLAVPAMITVVVSLFVQKHLTRKAKYPSLYEAQVISPADSPVHQAEYLETILNRLRQKEVRLPPELVAQEAVRILAAGGSIPLPDGRELSTLRVSPALLANGKALSNLDLMPAVRTAAILRGETVIFSSENQRLQSGDLLVVLSSDH